MAENYTILLNSQNPAGIVNNGNLNSYSYYINWSSQLPKKFQNWNVTFTLKSINTATNLTANAIVSINLGQSNMSTQNNQPSSMLGICYPVPVQQDATHWNYYYNSTLNDNTPVTVSYPSSDFITVTFQDFSYTTGANNFVMYNYVLQMMFEPLFDYSATVAPNENLMNRI